MIDIHCHILPGVDDGAADWETALDMCRMALRDGITHIVATPHANGRYQFDRAAHLHSLAELKRLVPEIEFSLGCDFHVSYDSVDDAIQNPARYTIGHSRYLLVELSDFYTPQQMTEALFRLCAAELIPVVTHPERNPVIRQYPSLVLDFARMGCLIQVTADSITGAWGSAARQCSRSLLKSGVVSAIATDAHETRKRKPVLSSARRAAARLIGDSLARHLVEVNPRAIINNQPLAN